MKLRKLLHGLLDQSRTQAARADADTLMALADDSSYGLNIWIEHAPGLVIRMADIVS